MTTTQKKGGGEQIYTVKQFLHCREVAMYQLQVDCGKSKMGVVTSKFTAK